MSAPGGPTPPTGSTGSTGPQGPPEPSTRLVLEWAGYGIVVAAARFVPVPLLDDVIRENATRVAVLRTLRAHDRAYPAAEVEAVYAGVDAPRRARALRYLASVPRRLLLFPVRKYVAVFGAVKGVPEDVLTVLLLGRTLHRHLAGGGLADAQPEPARQVEARRLRRAFDLVLEEMDLRVVTGALGEVLSRGRSLTGAAVAQGRTLLTRSGEPEPPDDSDRPDAELRAAADDVAGVMHRREVLAVLQEFDRRVVAKLADPRLR